MTPQEIFRHYAAEQRARNIDGYLREDLGHLVRHTATRPGLEGWVFFAELPAGREDAIIDEQIRHFEAAGQAFEWKVYDFDAPADLRARLEARGFVAGPVEAFLVHPVAPVADDDGLPAGVEIRRVTDAAGVDDLVAVQEQVWDEVPESFRGEMLLQICAGSHDRAVFCAYIEGKPVASAWVIYPPGADFADLHGGAVLREHRGCGIYSALLNERLADAHERGCRFLAVDAAPMSRPILLRKGFQLVCETWPMRWRRPVSQLDEILARIGLSQADVADRRPFPEASDVVSVGPDCHSREAFLAREAAAAWLAMRDAAKAAGLDLLLVSAFRSYEYQKGLWEKKLRAGQTPVEIRRVLGLPGFSQHHTGCAIDVGAPGCADLTERFESTREFGWLGEQAAGFGFTMPYSRGNRHGVTYEPWHWVFAK